MLRRPALRPPPLRDLFSAVVVVVAAATTVGQTRVCPRWVAAGLPP